MTTPNRAGHLHGRPQGSSVPGSVVIFATADATSQSAGLDPRTTSGNTETPGQPRGSLARPKGFEPLTF